MKILRQLASVTVNAERRAILRGGVACTVAAGVSLNSAALGKQAAATLKTGPWSAPLSELAASVFFGQLDALAYAEHCLERLDETEWIRAFACIDRAHVLHVARVRDSTRTRKGSRAASPPLFGIPLAIKDNIDTADLPTAGGTPALDGLRPPRNAPVIDALLNGGGLVFGKTKLHELAFGGTTSSGYFGAVQNPWRRGYFPGGSSGGTAAAIAAGVVPAGLGTDTAGSVRMPASLCGIAGFRPTLGRYPTAGVLPLSHTRDTVGPMGRTAADVAWMDGALRGVIDPIPAVPLRGVRLGLLRDVFYHELDSMTEQVMEQALKKLEDAGAELIEINGDEIRRMNDAISGTVLVYEMIEDIPAYLRASVRGVEFEYLIERIYTDDIREIFRSQLAGHARLESAYRKALDIQRPELISACDALFRKHRLDAFVLPATPLPARPITQSDQVEFRGTRVSASQLYTRNADIASNIGLPGLCVCAGLTPDGLPVGIEFDGPSGNDRHVLGLGVAFEEIRGLLPQAVQGGRIFAL